MNTNHDLTTGNHHHEINLFDYWRVIKKYRKMIAWVVMAVSVLAVIVSFILPKNYRAEALIIPVTSKGGGGGGISALTSQFGGLASLAGVSMPGSTGEMEKFVTILKSRTLTENVIERENLMPILFESAWDARTGKFKSSNPRKQPSMEKAVRKMKSAVTIIDDKKNKTIKIVGVFKTPELASRIVNAYIDELQQFIAANAFTTAKRNRIFIEGQLEQNKIDLLEAGSEINEFYRDNRISTAEARVDVTLNRPQLPSPTQGPAGEIKPVDNAPKQQTQATSLASDLTNVGMQNISPEMTGILSQKADVENKIAEAKVVKNVPQQVYLSYLMLRRELLGKVNALLTSQYEMAKIEESKEDLAFQVIDKAVPPVMRFTPKRKNICMMAFFSSLLIGTFIAFFKEYLNRMKLLHSVQ